MDKAISVSQLSNYVKDIFNHEEMLFNISVYGEISSMSFSKNIVYFCLKDDSSMLNCVCFNAGDMSEFKNGDKVEVRGTFNYYTKMGKLSFAISKIQAYGEGDIFLKFIELKNRLEKEGIFDINHKKDLPKKIERVGVVTSKTGAVFHDIVNVITRRNDTIDIILSPCKVQGQGADISICEAIDRLKEYNCDVIIACRGGGSNDELNAYNSEMLVRKVYDIDTFILSAVGHETDFTLLDFVSDLRAPTPSAAAELVTVEQSQLKKRYELIKPKIANIAQRVFLNKAEELEDIKNDLISKYSSLLKSFQHKLDMLRLSLYSCNPIKYYEKGYVKIKKDGKLMKSVNDMQIGDRLDIEFVDGLGRARLEELGGKNEL